MTDNEIKCEKCFHKSVCEKKTCAECQGSYCDKCELYDLYNGVPYIENCEKFIDADLINRKEEMIEALVAGQETLQKAFAEKNAEIERLQKLLDDKCDRCIVKERIEAFKELAKAYKDQIKNYAGMFTDEGFFVSHEAVLSAVDFVLNNKLKEMVGDAE